MSQFLVYSRYHTDAEATPLAQLLEQAGIPFDVEHERDPLDKIYTGELSTYDPMIAIKVLQRQFNQVNDLVKSNIKQQLDDVNPAYYLFGFSNEELQQVLENPGEWNYFDQALATKLLSERNIDTSGVINSGQKAYYTPGGIKSELIILGYALTVLFFFGGLVLGLAILDAKVILRNGEKAKMFDDKARRHAGIIIIIFFFRSLIPFSFPFAEIELR